VNIIEWRAPCEGWRKRLSSAQARVTPRLKNIWLCAIGLRVGEEDLRVFATKAFRRFQRKEGIADEALCEAIGRAERDLVDADLGGCLIKQRVARPGQGRRGGFRTIIAYRAGDRSVFLYGFAKSAMANMSAADERDLQDYGGMLLALDGRGIRAMIEDDELTEVACDDKG
jgi:hypothetical protein